MIEGDAEGTGFVEPGEAKVRGLPLCEGGSLAGQGLLAARKHRITHCCPRMHSERCNVEEVKLETS